MLIQRIKMAYKTTDTVFYVSLDNLWFQSHTLPELVDWLYLYGIRHLFLDEVHKYPNWPTVTKNLYDTYGNLDIVYTGSSMLEIDNSRTDLSRRQTLYTMQGLSFREYLTISRLSAVLPLTIPEKIFLGNTNLMYALGNRVNEGTLRETFFLNQLSLGHAVCVPIRGGFMVDNKYLFEIGGKNKTFEQIKDVQDSYLAVDGIDIGSRNRIPLWMFGLLY